MRAQTILLPLLFILADTVACKDDEPTGAEFGEPCGYDLESEVNAACAEGLECNIGVCADTCKNNTDCRRIEGYEHRCEAGVCQIKCKPQTNQCPQEFEVPLECVLETCVSAA